MTAARRGALTPAGYKFLLTEPGRPRRIREHPRAAWLAVAAVCMGAFMGQLDASIVMLTFPALERQFHAPLAAVEWVALSYLLVLIAFLTPAGRIADAAGRKLIYLYGFAVFTLASAACGLAPGLGWLIGFRVVQAAGAAMLQANSVALVVTSVDRDRMRAALGLQAAAQALGLALGPAIGAILVASAGWRFVFWVNVPVGLIAIVTGRYLLPRSREHTALGRFDFAGLALLVTASTALLLGLSAASGLTGAWWVAPALFGAAALAVAGFVARERRSDSPLVDLRLLRPQAVSAGLAGALFGYLILFGPLALFPVVLTAHRAVTGLVLTALPAGFAIAAVLSGRLLPAHWSTRARSLTGGGVSAVASLALAAAPAAPAWVAIWLAVLGAGLGVFMPANNSSVMKAIPAEAAAVAGGLVNQSRGLGTALGITVVTLCLNAGVHAGSGGGAGWGPQLALITLAGFAIAASMTGMIREDDPADPMTTGPAKVPEPGGRPSAKAGGEPSAKASGEPVGKHRQRANRVR